MEPDVKRDERVLIIDDQSLSQSYLRYALEQLGYNNISYAERAQTALNLCKQNSYDLIICGYNLAQGKDGYQLFEELKLSGLQKLSCGLMFISADTDPQLVHSVLELQPDEFLAKPFVIRDLQLRIERLLKRKQLLRPVYDLLETQQYQQALALLNQQLGQAQLHKLFPLLLKLKGDILIQHQQFDQAERFFRAMLQVQPFSWARTGLVRCMLQRGAEQHAFNELDKMLARADTRLFALDCLAELEFRQQHYQQAQRQYSQSGLSMQQQVVQARLLYLQDHKHKARQLLEDLQTDSEIHSLEDALDRAKALHEVGLTEASKNLFDRISHYCQQQQPEPMLAAYVAQEQQERAAMAHGPRELNNNAVHLYQHGNWQEAFNAFALAFQVMPKNAGIALNLWQTLLTAPRPLCSTEQHQKLLGQCQQLIEATPLKGEQQQRYLQLKQKYLTQLA